MTHSLELGPDAGINSTLAALRLMDRDEAPLAAGEHLVPGVFLDFDPEAGVEAMVQSRPGGLLSIRFETERPARWLALHVELGAFDLTDRMLFGLACRTASPEATTIRPCLRNGSAEGFSDIFFRKTVISYAEPSVHLDALAVADHADLNVTVPWRELILFFRPEGGAVDIEDLRVFVI